VQQIIGGVMDDGGTEATLAARIGLSARHLRRLFLAHLGATWLVCRRRVNTETGHS
jgi:AraC family transcriptional regulator, regulatory protein of adaptative response / DNA-3-methyladenine glycosylase II